MAAPSQMTTAAKLGELLDKNKQAIPEGDYIAMWDLLQKKNTAEKDGRALFVATCVRPSVETYTGDQLHVNLKTTSVIVQIEKKTADRIQREIEETGCGELHCHCGFFEPSGTLGKRDHHVMVFGEELEITYDFSKVIKLVPLRQEENEEEEQQARAPTTTAAQWPGHHARAGPQQEDEEDAGGGSAAARAAP